MVISLNHHSPNFSRWIQACTLCYVNLINYMDRYTVSGMQTYIYYMYVLYYTYNTVTKTGFVNQSGFDVLNRCIGRCWERIWDGWRMDGWVDSDIFHSMLCHCSSHFWLFGRSIFSKMVNYCRDIHVEQ